MTLDANQPYWTLPLSLPLGGKNAGHRFNIDISVWNLFYMYEVIHRDPERVTLMIATTLNLANQANEQQLPDPLRAAMSVWMELISGFTGNENVADLIDKPTPDEESVLGFTYMLLKSRQITHMEAAATATVLLSAQPKFTSNAWRKRVDRWAKRNGLTAVEQRKRVRKGE